MDAIFKPTAHGGELVLLNGQVKQDTGLEGAVYLSLFGGNDQDSGEIPNDRKQWWGNLTEDDAERRYRSRTQFLMNAEPLTTGSLQRIRDAVIADLAWMTSSLASSVEISLSIPRVNWLGVSIQAVIKDTAITAYFEQEWVRQ